MTCARSVIPVHLEEGNRQPPQGPRGSPGIFEFGVNPCRTPPWEGLGGNWSTQMVPGYHANHSPRKKSRETSWGTNPSTKLCFSGPLFGPKKGPGAFLGEDVGSGLQNVGSGLQKWVPGSKISKFRIEKTCRTHWSMPQTEPYVASYGQIHFWDGGGQKMGDVPFPWGDPSAPGATPKLQGQPLCPWGNPKAPGATPLPLGQPLCPGATPLPLGQPLSPRGNPFSLRATPLPQGF